MDNFILYDDISKTENSIIYKGRRKGSINFVAIHCIDKSLRPEITNLVRLTFELSHKNIVKFYEWYETSNHLWLVVELCTAGTLDILLEQDGCLPESSIRQFGIDLIEGLFHIHSLGMLFCDLIPRKIMIDGNGTLKLSDFGLSKLEGEDLEQIFQETFDATSQQWSQSISLAKPPKVYQKPFGEIEYLAPEVLLGEESTKESDLWSLGVNFYQMYTGQVPFISEDREHLKQLIISKELPNPKGNKLSTKPSPEFLSLLRGLLEKNPLKRYDWPHLIRHPFWENRLLHLLPTTLSTKSMMIDGGKEQQEENGGDGSEMNDNVNETHFMNMSRLSTDRNQQRATIASQILEKHPEVNVSFSISSRLPISPQTTTLQTRNPVQYKESDEPTPLDSSRSATTTAAALPSNRQQQYQQNGSVTPAAVPAATSELGIKTDERNEYRSLFFTVSELTVSSIVDNPKIQKPSPLKFEPRVLPLNNPKLFKAETFLQQINKDDFVKAMDTIKANTNVPQDKSAGAIKLKLHLMNYIGTLCCESSKLADAFLQIELYKDLLGIIKNGHNLEMKMKAARIFALMFNKARKLDTSKEMTDVVQTLLEIIAANRKDIKFKQTLLPALGELIYFLSYQESLVGKSVDSWSVPSSVYITLIKNISSNEDLTINHIICKIIENVASTSSSHNVQKLLNQQSDLVNSLWACYNQSAMNENLRVACLNALCMLSSHSISVFQSLVEKVTVDPILECLGNQNSQIQLAVLTMIAMLANETNTKHLLPEKKLIAKLVTIFESTSVICRAKAYLLAFVLLKQQNDLLIMFTQQQSKFINSIERDVRKTHAVKEEHDYLNKILSMLIDLLTTVGNCIMIEAVESLESVYGRKNPSTQQTKQLKRVIPNTTQIKALMSSQMFRARLIDDDFVEKFGKLIKLSKPINNGDLNLDSICGQAGLTADYIDAIVCILEIFVQNRESILMAYTNSFMNFILPSLIEHTDSLNSDLKVESIKVISELTSLYLNKQEQVDEAVRKKLKQTIEAHLVDTLNKLLIQSEPLPFFSLRIIQTSLNYDITLISSLKIKNVLPNIFKLFNNYKTKTGSSHMIKILNVINLWSSTVDPMDLYENGVIDSLKYILNDLARVKKLEEKQLIETLIESLRIIDNLLKFVSELVKKALQAKKSAGPNDQLAQQAEKLLQTNKPLVTFCNYFITLLVNEDSDVSELSCKILWIMMQLFGSDCKDLMNKDNLNILLTAILNSNSKKQKILLRIVKRIITADSHNADAFKVIGQTFLDNMRNLKNTANSEANGSLSTMIDEILKIAS